MDDNKTLTLDLSKLNRTRVLIDGDENRALYLNLSDMNILVRFKEKYEELKNLESNAMKMVSTKSSSDTEEIFKIADALKETDAKMREALDYIYDAEVSNVCAPSGSMYDLIDGKVRYEHILDALSSLYEKKITEETKKMENNLKKHTQKYTKH